jgi:ABC-type multidrug transport system permease subunit
MSQSTLAASIWHRELTEFVMRPRAMVIKLAFPLVVALPLVLSAAPAFYAGMALTMLVAVIGTLGAGAVLTRERTAGLTLRYRLLPRQASSLLLERLAANAAIDLGQVLPVLVLVAVRHPADLIWWPALLLGTAAVLLTGNVLGAWASTTSSSPGEVMLVIFLPLLPALFLSGVFVPLGQPLLTISRFLPFTYLHAALVGGLGGSSALAGLSEWQTLIGSLAFLIIAVVAGALLGRVVLEAD